MKKTVFVTLLILCYPSLSFAYIDPGILSIAVQSVYAIVAGAVFTYVLTPWHKVKTFIGNLLGKKKNNQNHNDDHAA